MSTSTSTPLTASINVSWWGVRTYVYFETETAAQAFVATLPKTVLAKQVVLHSRNEVLHAVRFEAALRPDGVNGDLNETGIRRTRRFLQGLRTAGFEIVIYETGGEIDNTTAEIVANRKSLGI